MAIITYLESSTARIMQDQEWIEFDIDFESGDKMLAFRAKNDAPGPFQATIVVYNSSGFQHPGYLE